MINVSIRRKLVYKSNYNLRCDIKWLKVNFLEGECDD